MLMYFCCRFVCRKFFIVLFAGFFLATTLVPPGTAVAQGVSFQGHALPAPDRLLPSSMAYVPAVIKGLFFDAKDPLRFRFIVDTGDADLAGLALQEESHKLVRYFMAGLTMPDKDFWVNLSPYEKDRMIPESFGNTEMGRDLLAQDYILKQMMSSLMSPEQALGKEFWHRVQAKARNLYGSAEIPLNTFNKVWIVPEKAVLFEKNGQVLVGLTHLKVMLEEDFIFLQETSGQAESQQTSTAFRGAAADVVREVLIPELEREVNEGRNFAVLRQIFHSMVLAIWVKRNFRTGLLGQIYMDQNKTPGIEVVDKTDKNKIFDQYVEAFRKGVYSHITEELDFVTGDVIPRKYFSGGFGVAPGHDWAQVVEVLPATSENMVLFPAAFNNDSHGKNVLVDVAMVPAGAVAAEANLIRRLAQVVVFGFLLSVADPAIAQARVGLATGQGTAVLHPQEVILLEKDVRGLVYNTFQDIKDRPQFLRLLSMGSRIFPVLSRMVIEKRFSDGTELSGDQLRWSAYLAVRLAPDQGKAEKLEHIISLLPYPWNVKLEAESGLRDGGREKQRAGLFSHIKASIDNKFLKLTSQEVVLLAENVAQLKAPYFSVVKGKKAFQDILSMGSKVYPYLVRMVIEQKSLPEDQLKWLVYLAIRTAPDELTAERLKEFIDLEGYSVAIRLEAGAGMKDGFWDKERFYVDKAQQASQEKTPEKNLGGISLDPALFTMHIERDGQGVPLSLNQQDPAMLHIPGLVPVITGMIWHSDVLLIGE